MTRTQYFTATSIDGFIADADNSLDWLFQVGGTKDEVAEKKDRFSAFFAGVGAMVMGSTTYEWVVAHDDLVDEPRRWRTSYGDVPCWVLTHRELPIVAGADVSFTSGDVAAVHEDMVRAADGKNVWIVGGGDVVGQFADLGLLDEIQLGIAPVVLGGGAPLLPRTLTGSLSLREVQTNSAFVFVTYDVGPKVRNG